MEVLAKKWLAGMVACAVGLLATTVALVAGADSGTNPNAFLTPLMKFE